MFGRVSLIFYNITRREIVVTLLAMFRKGCLRKLLPHYLVVCTVVSPWLTTMLLYYIVFYVACQHSLKIFLTV